MRAAMYMGLMVAASAPAAGADAPPGPRCAALAPVVGPARACAETALGVAVAASAPRARELAAIGTEGERRFALRFGRPVPAYAIIETEGAAPDPALADGLRSAGYAWRLPWLSRGAMAAGFDASISRAVRARAASMHLDAAQTDGLLAAAHAQQASRTDPATLAAMERSSLPHELGHGWFIKAFWPDASPAKGDHYGGPGPDWMDETAAILMEDDRLADRRRAQFAATYGGADRDARERLLDLGTFLSGGHPALPKVDLSSGTPGGVTVLTGAEAAGIAAAASGFYLQARMFAYYVIDRSGDPAAFRTAALRFGAGAGTAQWLAADGARLRLPATMPALEEDWRRWLATRLGPVPPA